MPKQEEPLTLPFDFYVFIYTTYIVLFLSARYIELDNEMKEEEAEEDEEDE